MDVEAAWISVGSELFVNLAAGWFGAAFVVPSFLKLRSPYNLILLTADLLFGIVALLVSVVLRSSL